MRNLFGGIEAGGTKFKCVVADEKAKIILEKTIPTTEPESTIQDVISFFQKDVKDCLPEIKAVGIGSFGPLDLNPTSLDFGSITATPKPGWSYFPIKKTIEEALNIPTVIDTDVNAAALGEKMWGVGKEIEDLLYLTIGTGIGGGAVVNGRPIHGLIHPEMGHLQIPHDMAEDPFGGCCPFHGDCFEGLASGPALARRWGMLGEDLPEDHAAWALEAKYLAYALASYICILSPQRIVLGGGVMRRKQLFKFINSDLQKILNGYIQSPIILERPQEYIVAPALGERSGLLGSVALAMMGVD
jgi:fructokinase